MTREKCMMMSGFASFSGIHGASNCNRVLAKTPLFLVVPLTLKQYLNACTIVSPLSNNIHWTNLSTQIARLSGNNADRHKPVCGTSLVLCLRKRCRCTYCADVFFKENGYVSLNACYWGFQVGYCIFYYVFYCQLSDF